MKNIQRSEMSDQNYQQKQKLTVSDFSRILKTKGYIEQAFADLGKNFGFYNQNMMMVLLKDKVLNLLKKHFVNKHSHSVLVDTPIITQRSILEKSGHVGKFFDFAYVSDSGKKYRADHFIEEFFPDVEIINTHEFFENFRVSHDLTHPISGENLVETIQENLMYALEDGDFLRPETCQNIFVDYRNFLQNSPKASVLNDAFMIAQHGKTYRKELTGAQTSLFRRREFEMFECEFFCKRGDEDVLFEEVLAMHKEFYTNVLGIDANNLVFRELSAEDRAHYSRRTVDVEYRFPWGDMEVDGIANRTNFDVKNHHGDEDVGVVETSFGLDRILLMLLFEYMYVEENEHGEYDYGFAFQQNLQPIDVVILPIQDMKRFHFAEHVAGVVDMVGDMCNVLVWDTKRGSMPKRYREADRLGARVCIVIDQDVKKPLGDAYNDGMVGMRFPKSDEQVRVKYERGALRSFLFNSLFL